MRFVLAGQNESSFSKIPIGFLIDLGTGGCSFVALPRSQFFIPFNRALYLTVLLSQCTCASRALPEARSLVLHGSFT